MTRIRQDTSEDSRFFALLNSAPRALLWSCAILLGGLGCQSQPEGKLCQPAQLDDPAAYTKSVEEARSERDSLFHLPDSSPVAKEDIPDWKGLEFYPVEPSYVLDGPLIRRAKAVPVEIPDSGGETRKAENIGYFLLDLGAGPEKLSVFHMLESDSLFLPFLDATSGAETYPAGRYLELEKLGDDRYRLDFNLAYNPYCAYGGDWSCPITPESNRLKAAVRAGERGYKFLHE